MNTGIKRTLIALSVAAAFALPATSAFAQKTAAPTNSTTVQVQKTFTVDGKINVKGKVNVNGDAEAVIHDGQGSTGNASMNNASTNRASIGDKAGNGASGNIGVNVAAGDNNVQANEAALSASDASQVFGTAQVYNTQATGGNTTTNVAATNRASLGGSGFNGASGNLNVNVASGSSNLQKNALAASAATNSSRAAVASIQNTQVTAGNSTSNDRMQVTTSKMVSDLGITLTGKFAGIVDQYGDQYPDLWGPDTDSGSNGQGHDPAVHPSEPFLGHVDLDSDIQGGQDRPVGDSLNSDGTVNTDDTSKGGGLSFNQAGDIQLSGAVTGSSPVTLTTWKNTTNNASIGGSAFGGASGNIGVNVASGSNNLQSNILSMSVTQGGGVSHSPVTGPVTGG